MEKGVRVLERYLDNLLRRNKKKRKGKRKSAKMFPGMFMRKPDKEAALKQLKSHVAMFGVWVAVIRVTPYILHYFSDDELKLEL